MWHSRAGKWSAFAETYDYGNEMRLWLLRDESDDRRARMQPVVLQVIDEQCSHETDPATINLRQSHWNGPDNEGFLQTIVDLAWQLGVRPSQMREAASETTALRAHLSDMRAIAMDKIDDIRRSTVSSNQQG